MKRTKAAGTNVQVIKLRSLLEISDIDEWTSRDEITKKLSPNIDQGEQKAKIISLRKISYG